MHLSGVPHGNMGFSYIFGNGALYSQKIPLMKGLGSSCTLYNSLAICNVWDYVFMPGSGGYLLLMFMIKKYCIYVLSSVEATSQQLHVVKIKLYVLRIWGLWLEFQISADTSIFA